MKNQIKSNNKKLSAWAKAQGFAHKIIKSDFGGILDEPTEVLAFGDKFTVGWDIADRPELSGFVFEGEYPATFNDAGDHVSFEATCALILQWLKPTMDQKDIDALAMLLEKFLAVSANEGAVNGRKDGSIYGRRMDRSLASDTRGMLVYYGAQAKYSNS